MNWGYLERGLRSEWPADVLTECLQAPLAQVVACAQACVAQAGLPAGALDAVYLTGGSSSLTPFRAALQQAFSGVPMVEGDVFGGVAAGLAVG
jgi:hypothetical chaperone protein